MSDKALYNPYAGIEGYLQGFPAPEVGNAADYGKGYVSGWGGLPGDLGRALRNVQILRPDEPLLPSSEDIGKALGADIESEEFFAGTLGLPGVDDVVMKALMLWGGIGAGAATFNKALGRGGPLNYEEGMVAFHGSKDARRHIPKGEMTDNIYDLFDPRYIGDPTKGEGAIAFGHGFYFAENPGVAKTYQQNLADFDIFVGGKKVDLSAATDEAAILDTLKAQAGRTQLRNNSEIPQEVINELRNYFVDAGQLDDVAVLDRMVDKGLSVKQSGHLYEVDIPDETIDKMLDWDAPLSEQPESVRKALDNALDETLGPKGESQLRFTRNPAGDDVRQSVYDLRKNDATGQQIYDYLASHHGQSADVIMDSNVGNMRQGPKAASDRLSQLGIPGIRYYDGASRNVGTNVARRTKVNGTPIKDFVPDTGDFMVDSQLDNLMQHLEQGRSPAEVLKIAEKNAEPETVKAFKALNIDVGEGTRNIVVFDPDDIKSVKRDGELVYKQ